MRRTAFVICFVSLCTTWQVTGQSGYKPAVPGAVASRTVESKLQETVSVQDFGADPTGKVDSLAAFNAARDAVRGGGRIYVPHGV